MLSSMHREESTPQSADDVNRTMHLERHTYAAEHDPPAPRCRLRRKASLQATSPSSVYWSRANTDPIQCTSDPLFDLAATKVHWRRANTDPMQCTMAPPFVRATAYHWGCGLACCLAWRLAMHGAVVNAVSQRRRRCTTTRITTSREAAAARPCGCRSAPFLYREHR